MAFIRGVTGASPVSTLGKILYIVLSVLGVIILCPRLEIRRWWGWGCWNGVVYYFHFHFFHFFHFLGFGLDLMVIDSFIKDAAGRIALVTLSSR